MSPITRIKLFFSGGCPLQERDLAPGEAVPTTEALQAYVCLLERELRLFRSELFLEDLKHRARLNAC